MKLILSIVLLTISSFIPCYTIDNLGVTSPSGRHGSKVGVYATVNNCSTNSRRLYVKAVATDACGNTSNIFVSSGRIYRPYESKYFYSEWRIPNRYALLPFGRSMCNGQATITMTVYEKSFWGSSNYVSSATTSITIK
jgi:hypothetical protein